MPFNRYLVDYFRTHKNMGSRDRKFYSNLSYSFFRSGKAFDFLNFKDKLLYSFYLCNNQENSFLSYFNAHLNDTIALSLNEKFISIKKEFKQFDEKNIFPYKDLISEGFNPSDFIFSQLSQSKVFIRVRERYLILVKEILTEKKIEFESDLELNNCLSFPANIKLQNIFSEREMNFFEVQDRSSQWASNQFSIFPNEQWWDACAGSGGKSLALIDKEESVNLICSDIRESILDNLDIRFKNIAFRKYKKRKIDLLYEITSFEKEQFDGIILDAPCSGSGTWGRSPEMIQKFDAHVLDGFYKIQTLALANTCQFLKQGKLIYYITCSVFKRENEDVLSFVEKTIPLKLVNKFYIKGKEFGADSMFIAIFEKL